MRKRLTWILAVAAAAALLLAGVASAYKPAVIKVGNLVLTFNGGFTPTKLSKTKLTPITLNVSGKIATDDGLHPPPLTSLRPRNRQERRRSTPRACRPAGSLSSKRGPPTDAKKVCGKALIGTGKTQVELLFPESKPVQLHSELLVFNGGTRAARRPS